MNNRSIGMILLCLYLLIHGILALTSVTIVFVNVILGILAVGAAVFLFMGK